LNQTAYAKINLALHVRRRREDGYHAIETLFAFVDDGDRLTAAPAARDEVRVMGEFAEALGDPFDNIVARALGMLPRTERWRVTLDKRLPVAAGLGGGSADAGAIFRLVRSLAGLPEDWHAIAASLGADVPACVESEARIGMGTGTELAAVANDLAGAPVLLVNPRLPLATGPVFAGWDGIDRGPLPLGAASVIAREGRNDLEEAAIRLCPAIAEVLALLATTGARLVRMSGSGATCFALYADAAACAAAEAQVRCARPGWWTLAGRLRP
jgi:4-diphosphocytidyl-2-C-methyl-D-erythritol kinase